ncbi:hypothetical protein BTJ23_09140, partial [Lactobacillus delbrueckii subsp. bulgaricus]|nr:hypothetical protein [Lactobacillus delbrueckii subsp. bulgaricus]MBT9076776.1 hypothetical protein [Lactobacillus delbrueckii subsp. bulgaricus]
LPPLADRQLQAQKMLLQLLQAIPLQRLQMTPVQILQQILPMTAVQRPLMRQAAPSPMIPTLAK